MAAAFCDLARLERSPRPERLSRLAASSCNGLQKEPRVISSLSFPNSLVHYGLDCAHGLTVEQVVILTHVPQAVIGMGLKFVTVSIIRSLEETYLQDYSLIRGSICHSTRGYLSQCLSSPSQNNGFQLDIVGERLRSLGFAILSNSKG